MKIVRRLRSVKDSLARGGFPHEFSFFLDLPWRYLVLPPRELLARLDLTTTNRVLEVGTGTGFYSVEVARRVSDGHLELLDLQPEMLKKARQKLEARGLSNVGYTLSDAGKLPLEADSFDVIFLVAVLGEISDQRAFLSEARRVLKSGGVLSISEHLPDPDFSPFVKVKSAVEREGFKFSGRYGRRWSYTVNFSKLGVPGDGDAAQQRPAPDPNQRASHRELAANQVVCGRVMPGVRALLCSAAMEVLYEKWPCWNINDNARRGSGTLCVAFSVSTY